MRVVVLQLETKDKDANLKAEQKQKRFLQLQKIMEPPRPRGLEVVLPSAFPSDQAHADVKPDVKLNAHLSDETETSTEHT